MWRRKESDGKNRTVCLPGHVQKRSAADEDASYSHAIKVVEPALKTFEITTVSEIKLSRVVLEGRVKVVIVGGVSISEFVEKDGVEGNGPPICW